MTPEEDERDRDMRRKRADAALSEQYRIEMTQFIAGDCPSCMRTPTEIWCQSGPGCVRIKLQAKT